MELNDYILFFNNLYDVNSIPLCVFQGDTLLLQIPASTGFTERIRPTFLQLKERGKDVTYISTTYDAYCGLVRISEHDLWAFVGPYFLTPVTKEALPAIIKEMHVPAEEAERTRVLITGLPYGPLHRFLSYLSCVHFALNHKAITIEEIDYNADYRKLDSDINTEYTHVSYESREYELPQNTYLLEMQRLDLISNGNTEELKKTLVTPLPGRQGVTASNSLRQAKNTFIANCTMYSRAAIAGGMDVEDAYSLSDIYIRTSESYNKVIDVERLMKKMPLDFAERVAREARYKNASQPILSAIHYIKDHINQPLQADTIASHVNLSTSYFLKRFKAETGYGISEFIARARIEEACTLLSYTDKSLTEISNYLDFSSQSYFQQIFKKFVGMTPAQYRNIKKTPAFIKKL